MGGYPPTTPRPAHPAWLSGMLLWAVFGCAPCEDEFIPAEQHELPEPEPPRALEDDPDGIFDAEGNLRESDETVAGLVLPRGLETQEVRGERRHAWVTDIDASKVLRYFGPRLITGHVTQEAGGATYHRAAPQGSQGASIQMDVGIHPRPGGGTRVELFELPPVPQNPPSAEELIRRFEADQQRLD